MDHEYHKKIVNITAVKFGIGGSGAEQGKVWKLKDLGLFVRCSIIFEQGGVARSLCQRVESVLLDSTAMEKENFKL